MRSLPLVAAAIAVCATSAGAQELPARKPGLWEMTTQFTGRAPQFSKHCIDATTDKAMNAWGGATRGTCSKHDVKNLPGTITIESICQAGAVTTKSFALINGSFDVAYTVTLTTRVEGGPPPPGMPHESHTTISARHAGPCAADQKPGDIIMSNGTKMNILDMQKAAAAKRQAAPKPPAAPKPQGAPAPKPQAAPQAAPAPVQE